MAVGQFPSHVTTTNMATLTSGICPSYGFLVHVPTANMAASASAALVTPRPPPAPRERSPRGCSAVPGPAALRSTVGPGLLQVQGTGPGPVPTCRDLPQEVRSRLRAPAWGSARAGGAARAPAALPPPGPGMPPLWRGGGGGAGGGLRARPFKRCRPSPDARDRLVVSTPLQSEALRGRVLCHSPPLSRPLVLVCPPPGGAVTPGLAVPGTPPAPRARSRGGNIARSLPQPPAGLGSTVIHIWACPKRGLLIGCQPHASVCQQMAVAGGAPAIEPLAGGRRRPGPTRAAPLRPPPASWGGQGQGPPPLGRPHSRRPGPPRPLQPVAGLGAPHPR